MDGQQHHHHRCHLSTRGTDQSVMLHLVLDHLMCPDMRRQTMVRVIRQKLYINTQCTTTKTTLAITAFIEGEVIKQK